jgi:hypothetical protein
MIMTTNERKRKAMDAVAHPETTKQMRAAGLSVPAKPVGPVAVIKQRAMDAVSHVETIRQFGAMRTLGGAGVYLAHIRQMDRQAQPNKQVRPPAPAKRDQFGRDV